MLQSAQEYRAEEHNVPNPLEPQKYNGMKCTLQIYACPSNRLRAYFSVSTAYTTDASVNAYFLLHHLTKIQRINCTLQKSMAEILPYCVHTLLFLLIVQQMPGSVLTSCSTTLPSRKEHPHYTTAYTFSFFYKFYNETSVALLPCI